MAALTSATPSLFHGCRTVEAQALPYCDTKLSTAERAHDLLSRLSVSEKIAQLSPTRGTVSCHEPSAP